MWSNLQIADQLHLLGIHSGAALVAAAAAAAAPGALAAVAAAAAPAAAVAAVAVAHLSFPSGKQDNQWGIRGSCIQATLYVYSLSYKRPALSLIIVTL